jgi:hypothetical protein
MWGYWRLVILEMGNLRVINTPIKREGQFKLSGYWTLNPHHGIDPLTYSRILLKGAGVNQIHTPSPNDSAIDYEYLTM